MKTAVEWLFKWMIDNKDSIIEERLQAFEQAKEMEKQNIIESYCQGCFDMWKDNGIVPRETADEYYNETFKSE
jgi:Leu/Phe-tRNA-protein transferase